MKARDFCWVLCLLLAGWTTSLWARDHWPRLRFVTLPAATWAGDTLILQFQDSLDGQLRGARSYHLQPVYVAGRDSVRYPAQRWYSSSEWRYHRRRPTDHTAPADRLLKAVPGTVADYRAAHRVPADGHFCLFVQLRTCCDSLTTDTTLLTVPARHRPAALPAPKAEARIRSEAVTLRINYPLSRWEIRPELGDNRRELHRIDSLLQRMDLQPKHYVPLRVVLIGYASPEGPHSFNQPLSERRAEAIRSYIRSHYALPEDVPVELAGRAEDWEGLRAWVAASTLEAKEEVLHIIDTVPQSARRTEQLKALRGGSVYRYLLKEVYPSLRRMVLRIDYQITTTDETPNVPK